MQAHQIFAVVLLGAVAAVPGRAEDLIYRPVNPNFGGNPLNGPNLLNSAIAQNKFKAPSAGAAAAAARAETAAGRSSGQSFAERLDREILSRLSRDIVANAFGEMGIESGTFDTGLNTIIVETTLDETIVNIIDNATGEKTVVTIPMF